MYVSMFHNTSAPTLKGRTSFGGTYPDDASATEWGL